MKQNNGLSKPNSFKAIPKIQFNISIPEKRVSLTGVVKAAGYLVKNYLQLGVTVNLITTVLLAVFVVSSFKAPREYIQSVVSAEVDSTTVKEVVPKVDKKRRNEMAPVADPSNATEYIQKYNSVAIREMKKFGIPASITLAQGLVESNSGNSGLAKGFNNHFGMKCNNKHHRGCCVKWKDDSNHDSFKIFKTPWESFRAHSTLLSQGRYVNLKKHRLNYKGWAYGLKSVGYATDKNYASKLINVIQKYNLSQYDRE